MKKIFKSLTHFFVCISFFTINLNTVFAATKEEERYNKIVELSTDISSLVYYIDSNYFPNLNLNNMREVIFDAIIKSLNDENSQYFMKSEYDDFLDLLETSDFHLGTIYTVENDKIPLVKEILPNSYAEYYGIKKGDKILSINGKSTYSKDIKKMIFENFSKEIYKLNIKVSTKDNIVKDIIVPINKNDLKSVVYRDIKLLMNKKELKDNIAYIKISTINEDTYDEFNNILNTEIKGKSRLILDLRGNTGGSVESAIKIVQAIVPKGDIITLKDKYGKVEKYTTNLEKPPFEKIAILTDSLTASSSEIITSAIKDSKMGFTVGTKTYGKGTVQDVFAIKEGGAIKITVGEYFTRNGNKIDKVGIEADFPVNPILLISEKENINGKKFKDTLTYIGYKNENLKQIQAKNGLKETGILNKETVDFINTKIYVNSILNDEVLLKAYDEIIK